MSSRTVIPVICPKIETDETLWRRLRASIQTGQLTNNGPLVQQLETQAAVTLEQGPIHAVSSGSMGLLVAAHAIGPLKTVVLPSFTYIATLNAVQLAGWTPLFCDVDPHTWTLCPKALASLMCKQRVDGVVAVNVFGVPPDLRGIRDLIGDSPLLYDNAHGFGTVVDGVRTTAHADIEVFSLHATKTLASLEGGLVRCSTESLDQAVRALRNHGKTDDPLNPLIGFNAKMNEWSAALALSSLNQIEAVLARRQHYWSRLRGALETAGFGVQAVPASVTPNGQDLVLTCTNRDAVQRRFSELGIETRPYFGLNLHQLRRFNNPPALPVTERLNETVLALPMHSRMSEETLERIETAIGANGPP
jgi:dTDP-4-amino-4,6-dideoxygalactose transaminase